MPFLMWVIKNPLLSAALGMLLTVSLYAGVQKVGRVRAEANLKDCSAAIEIQNAAVERLGDERRRLLIRLRLAQEDANNIMADSKVQIDALLNRPPAQDCNGNVKRFATQLEGIRW